ncbi:MAG: aldo/keto reductase [Sphaerochaeta sp.]
MNKSDLGLGCWQFGPSFGFWDGQDQLDSVRVLHKALRDNIRHFDTAASYGNGRSEQVLGHQLKRFANTIAREDLTIATKIMPKSPSLVRKDVHKSLSRLCTPYLDILYLHWPSRNLDLPPILEAMSEIKSEGLVRSLGLSNFPLHLLPSFADYPISYLQAPCSLLWTKEIQSICSYCRRKDIKLVGYSPLGLGLLNGKHLTAPEDSRRDLYAFSENSYPTYKALYAILEEVSEKHQRPMAQIALKWSMSQDFDVLLLGARNKSQLEENLAAISIELSGDEITALDRASANLAATIPSEQDNLFGHRW